MELLLMRFAHFIMSSGISTALSNEGDFGSEKIGFVVLGIILGPVFLLTLGAIIELPKKSRIPELFLGSFVLMVTALVLGFAAIGIVLKFVVPQ